MDNLNTVIKKARLIVFNATAIVSVIGYVLDIVGFSETTEFLLYNNIFVIVVTVSAFLLFHLKIFSLSIGYSLIVYGALLNVLLDIFNDLTSEFNLYFFFRDSLFIILVLTLAALIASKYNALIISGIYLSATIIFNQLIQNEFLQSSLAMLVLYVAAYSVVVYFFVDILEKTISDRAKKEKMIYDQNKSLNEVNVSLEEKQQQIEEQAEELKSVNDILQQKNAELTELNATKNKFFSVISHDLKNPIGIILGFSEILKKQVNKLSVDKRSLYVNNLYESAKNTYNLLENLLYWARSQSGQIKMHAENVDLSKLIRSNITLLDENIQKKKITLSLNIPENPVVAFCNANMIDTVYRNMLSNAIKFSMPGGEIRITLTLNKDQKVVKTTISDTGIGISPEILDNLFSPGKNISTKGTAGEPGTGLGLILCKEFIEKNKGEIWVESELEKGSAFYFSLPISHEE